MYNAYVNHRIIKKGGGLLHEMGAYSREYGTCMYMYNVHAQVCVHM